jgi:hypothetical protein
MLLNRTSTKAVTKQGNQDPHATLITDLVHTGRRCVGGGSHPPADGRSSASNQAVTSAPHDSASGSAHTTSALTDLPRHHRRDTPAISSDTGGRRRHE